MTSPVSTTTTPPGPAGLPVVGNLLTFQREGPLDFYRNLWEEYGDTATASIGPIRFLMLSRPEHIQHVLVKHPNKYVKGISHEKLRVAIGNGILTLEGEAWARQRKLMQPTFTPRGILPFAELMVDESQQLIQRWRGRLSTDGPVDLNREMTHVTMKIISRSMFGLDMEQDSGHTVQALMTLLEYTSAGLSNLFDMPLFVPTAQNRRLKQAKQDLAEFLGQVIRRRRSGGLQDDLLSMLMSSRDADTGETMTDQQLHDEALIIFFAGHETTASLLTWTFYLLAKNPRVEQKLHAELAEVLGDRSPALDDLPKLIYSQQILDEALRLYSPVPMLARDLVEDDQLGEYHVAKRTMVILSLYNTHRHPEFWEKPLEFYPEHFEESAAGKRPRYAYLPFGAGPRICIGQHFAQMEGLLLLADIAQRFRLRLAAENDGAVRYVGVTRPAHPILMTLDPR